MADVELQEQSVPLKSAEQQQAGAEGTEMTTTTTTTTATSAIASPQGIGEAAAAVPPQGAVNGDDDGAVAAPPKSKEKKGGWFAKKKTQKPFGDGAGDEATHGTGEAGTKGDVRAKAEANNVKEEEKKMGKDNKDTNFGTKQQRAKCPFSFCRGSAQKVVVEEGGHAGGGQQANTAPWDERQPTTTTTFRFDLVQRDSAKLQEVIDLEVHDIFGEPDAVHSLDAVWKTALTVFLAVRNFCYKALSLIFGLPLAFALGFLFALFSVLSVFVFVPAGRLLSIPFSWVAQLWSAVVSAFCDPLCRSFALTFGNVKVSRYGINQDPTAVVLNSA